MKILKLSLLIATAGLALATTITTVDAKGGGHASGGHASGGHTSVGRSVARTSNAGARTVTTSKAVSRTSAGKTTGKATVKATAKLTSSRSYQSLNTTSQTLRLTGSKGYASYASHPYSSSYYSNNHYRNVWFNYWLFNHSWTQNQKAIAQANGISQDNAKTILANTKHVTITDSNGDKQVIIVTPKQYDKIKVGDKLTLQNNQLKLNGKVLSN